MRIDRRAVTVTSLGLTQTLAWASSYYLPAMLASSMARDLNISVQSVFAFFSSTLVLAALLGPLAGRCIDRYGGRPVLLVSNLVFAAGLACLAWSPGSSVFFIAWLLIGAGMGKGLYEAAFSTVVKLYGNQARNAITGITLFAGFASTVGWPLSAWLEVEFGWRTACLSWAALHLFVGMPLNASLPATASLELADDQASTPKRSEEHTSELQSLIRISYAVFCFKKKKKNKITAKNHTCKTFKRIKNTD